MTTRSASLSEQTEDLRASLREMLPADVLAAFDNWAVDLGERDFAARAISVGAQAPRFVLPEARGETVALDDLLAAGPVVLTFYRGAWCPYCNLQLRAYQQILPEVGARGAQLIAISPQLPDNSLSLAEKAELAFPVLSDVGNAVAEAYGIVVSLDEAVQATHRAAGIDLADFNGDASWRLPIPATYVIGGDGAVLFAMVHGDYRSRAEPAELLGVLDAATEPNL